MIELRSLRFQYRQGEFHLGVPELVVGQGEKVAIIGPSGSGKTTLLNLVAGISVAESGTVTVDGVAVDGLSDAMRRSFRITRIGFVFQDFELLDYLSVLDNVLHPYRISAALTLDRAVRERALALMQRVGIDDLQRRHPAELSHGEKQRTAICRALLPGPMVILADEATGNLDPENKLRILEVLFEAVAEQDATLVAVTHDHELLARFDRVIDFRQFHLARAA